MSKGRNNWVLIVMVTLFAVAFCYTMAAPLLGRRQAQAPGTTARSYTSDSTTIDATVEQDATLHVMEERTFTFSGHYNGVYWVLPTDAQDAVGGSVEPDHIVAGVIEDGVKRPFTESSDGSDSTFSVGDAASGGREVKLYSPHDDESATFYVTYDLPGFATRWSDASELYWQFVAPGWEIASNDVTCTVHLPEDSGDVRAWGHGDLSGSTSIDGGTVTYHVPRVEAGTFAEARIAFSPDALAGAVQRPEARLQAIGDEEARWSREANARRVWGLITAAIALACVVLDVLSVVFAVSARRALSRTLEDLCGGRYFRDIPLDAHPATLAYVWRSREHAGDDVTASIVQLTYEGLAEVTPDGVLTRTDKGACRYAPDVATLDYVFDGERSVTRSSARERSEESPSRVRLAWAAWEASVEKDARDRGLLGGTAHPRVQRAADGTSTASLLASVASAVGMSFLADKGLNDATIALSIFAIVAFCTVSALIAQAVRPAPASYDLSEEGMLVKARLWGLERWLRDFTRLDEAIPGDVALWDRLLVMAVAFGISDKVIEDLEDYAPEVLDEMRSADWYRDGDGHVTTGRGTPMSDIGSTPLFSDPASAFPSSSPSISSGSGGGFSGGGGGGGGSTGGGGAF